MMLYRKDRKNWEKSIIDLAKSNRQKNRDHSTGSTGKRTKQGSVARDASDVDPAKKKVQKNTTSMFGSNLPTSQSHT